MATSLQALEYKPEPAKDPAAGIEVAEFTPYKGLEAFFIRVMTIGGTSAQRSSLTLMLLELDSGLQAHERGDAEQAVRHHKNMLEHAKTALKNAPAEAQQIFIDITSAARGVKNADGTEKPWGRTLAAIVKDYKRGEEAKKNLSLLPAGQTAANFYASPRRTLRVSGDGYFSLDFTASAKQEKTTVWARPEYRNLGIVLEQMSKSGQPGRVDALVALSSLRTMNTRETEYLSDMRKGVKNDGQKNKSYAESRKRLQEATAKLLKNDALHEGPKSGVARWRKPVYTYAKRFEHISEGPSLIAKAFHAAASFFATHMMPSRPVSKFIEPVFNPKYN